MVMLFEDKVGTLNLVGRKAIADPRHNGGMNVGYFDGHVGWAKPDSVRWDDNSGPLPAVSAIKHARKPERKPQLRHTGVRQCAKRSVVETSQNIKRTLSS